MKTQLHQINLDGVTFEGDLPFYVSETRPELGPQRIGKTNALSAPRATRHFI